MNYPGPYNWPPGAVDRPRPRRTPWLPIVIGVILAGAALVVLLVLLEPAWFGLATPSPYRFGLFGGVFLVFFILIVIFFVVRVAFWSTRMSRYGPRYGGNVPPGGYGANRPVMIARMRYARGEITREQYEQILRDLGRRPGGP